MTSPGNPDMDMTWIERGGHGKKGLDARTTQQRAHRPSPRAAHAGQKGKLTRLKAKSSASKRPPAQGYDSLALLRGTQPSSSLVTLDACLRRQQIPGVRRLMEIALARIACSLPGAEARAFLRDRLLDLSSASETAVSYVALAGHLILRGREGDTAAHVRKLVPVMLPWAMVHQQGLRTMTLSTIREIFLSLPPAGPSSVLHASLPPTPPPAPNDSPTQISRDGGRDRGASARQMSSRSEGSGEDGPGTPGAGRGWAETWGEGAFLEAIQEHVLNHPDMKKLVLSCQPNVARHDPKEWVAVRTVMLATSSAPGHRALSPDGSPFEACPESVFEEINVYLNEARRDAKKAPGAGQHSRAQAAQGGAQPSTREGNVAGNTVADASGGTYQRKITPAGYQSEIYGASKPAAASQRSAQALRMLDVRAAKDGPILMEEVIGPTARRLAVDMAEFWDVSAGAGSRDRVANARSKAPGPVLVASLVDKVPNLAGLARTCEIFGAEQLVLPNMTCLKDPAFSEISVTAEKWLPMSAVAPGDLVSWLEQVSAAERAPRSVRAEHHWCGESGKQHFLGV